MTIATYADLQTQITNWLGGRTDLTAYYPDWITLFEACAARRLNARLQETSTTLTTVSGIVALPSDYVSTIRLTWAGSSQNVTLQYLDRNLIEIYYPSSPSNTPQSFTIEAGNLKVRPIDDTASAYTFIYRAKSAALSGTLNTLFTKYPDLYLFGALAEAGGFVDDGNQLTQWIARRNDIFDEIRINDFRERPSTMAVRPLAFTP